MLAAAPAPNLGDILQQLAAANACENPSLPLAGDLRRYMDSDFSVSNPQSTTSFSVLQLGGVMDLSSVSGASGADRARYVEDNWQAQIRAPVRSFILDELIPLTDEFNEQPDDEPVRHHWLSSLISAAKKTHRTRLQSTSTSTTVPKLFRRRYQRAGL